MPKPADPLSDTLYDMPTLNRLFFASSILLIAVTVWMAWQDYDRNWKHFQRDYTDLALKKAQKDEADLTAKLMAEHGFELVMLQQGINEARSKYAAEKDALEPRIKDEYKKRWDVANEKLKESAEKKAELFEAYWTGITAGIEEAKKQVEGKKQQLDELAEKREKNRGPLEKSLQKFQFDKSESDTYKFQAEKASVELKHAREHAADLKTKGDAGATHAEAEISGLEKDLKAAEERFNEKNNETIESKKAWEKCATDDAAFGKQIDEILFISAEIDKNVARLEFDLAAKKRQVTKLAPDWRKDLLNAPGVDFVAPTEKIDQNILMQFSEDLNFSSVFKIDRCTTCHLAIDKSGWTKEELPEGTNPAFFSHPNLELYVGDNSPHPVSKFGCTICHNGQGRSVDFIYAAHTPKNAKQEKEWEEKYSWKPVAHFDSPMLPTTYAEAACTKCHASQHRVSQADKLNEGKRVLEKVGCYGCHPIAGTEDLRKPGPSLYGLKYKVTKDWAYNWIADPTQFRPDTGMPKPFYASSALNEQEKADVERRNQAMIHGLVEFLWDSENLGTVDKKGYPAPPPGDAAKGKALVNAVGCVACHVVDKYEQHGTQYTSFGPNLSSVGSKLNPGWTFAWLKNPTQYFHAANMPNLRLTDKEAADATAYLMSLKHPEKFEERKMPGLDEKALDETIIDFKKGQMSMAQAAEETGKLSQQEKLLWLGRKAVNQMGCFGCHDIKSFEKTKKIGAELTGSNSTGTKDITKFDFGFRHELQHGHHPISNDKINWVLEKLKDPRTYDGGRIVAYEDRLRMPKFNLTPEEIEALTTYVLSFRREAVNPLYLRNMTHEETVIDRGKRLATLSNCASCHKVGVWPSRVTLTGDEENNNLREITDMTMYAARHIMTDGRQVDKISDDELAILRKKGVDILYRKGTWLIPSVARDLLAKNFRSILVYGNHEAGIRSLLPETLWPPIIVGEGGKVNPEWLYSFLMAPTTIRPWMQPEDGDYAKMGVRMPTFGFTSDEATLLVQHFAYLSGEKTPFRYDPPISAASREKMLAIGKAVFEARKCADCHLVVGKKVVTENPAPAFADVAPRIQKDWFEPWIRNPKSFAPGTGMTAFGEEQIKPEEVEPLREYIWSLHGK